MYISQGFPIVVVPRVDHRRILWRWHDLVLFYDVVSKRPETLAVHVKT